MICSYIARYFVKKIARAPGGVKKYKHTKLRGGGGAEYIRRVMF